MFQNEDLHDDKAVGQNAPTERKKQRRGFAAMDPARQRELAQRGGKAAHQQGRAHEFSADEARAAGKKGGASLAKDRAHMAEIGRKGGLKRSQNAALRRASEEPQGKAEAGQ